jgi:sulfatase modifying factor 1
MELTQKERKAIKDKDWRQWANEREAEPRPVVIKAGFWVADTPCSQAFWQAVLGGEQNPSHFQEGADALRRPVEQVPFSDDKKGSGVSGFLHALNQRLPEPRADFPSEEEWEYACRADTRTADWWGDEPDDRRANWKQTTQWHQSGGPLSAQPLGVARYAWQCVGMAGFGLAVSAG